MKLQQIEILYLLQNFAFQHLSDNLPYYKNVLEHKLFLLNSKYFVSEHVINFDDAEKRKCAINIKFQFVEVSIDIKIIVRKYMLHIICRK